MNIKIQDYNGVEIFYNDQVDRFYCEIHSGSKTKTRSRLSLVELREEIDRSQIKLTRKEFTPVEVYYGCYSIPQEATITCVRADSGVNLSYLDGEQQFIETIRGSQYRYIFERTPENKALIKELQEIKEELDRLQEEYADIKTRMKVYDVRGLEEEYND